MSAAFPRAPRAVNAADKAERLRAILDAAERLWLAQPEALPSVAAIAGEAGLSKGAVYLYLPSKEALWLALHERQLQAFFTQVQARARAPTSMGLDDLLAELRGFLDDTPAFLPLAVLSHGLLERQIPLELGLAFETRTQAALAEVVAELQPHFPQVSVALMMQSYALILGLWQLLRPTPLKALLLARGLGDGTASEYHAMLGQALHTLWQGARLPAAPPPATEE